MRTLKVFEIGVDELPVDGSHIMYFDQHTSFGMFEENYSKQGKVQYLYGDLAGAENLQDALAKGGFIDLTGTFHEEEDDEHNLSIPIQCNEYFLTEGMLWTYDHEYLPVLNPEMFPFQDFEYFSAGIENNWLEVLKNNLTNGKEDSDFPLPDKLEHIVRFNNKLFYLAWLGNADKNQWNFHNFYIFDDPEKSFDEIREELNEY